MVPFKSLKNTLIYGAIRIAVALAALVPLALLRRVGRALGALGWRLARKERERAREAARRVLGGEASGDAAARASFVHLGESAAEAVKLPALRRRFDRTGAAGPVLLAREDAARLDDAVAGGAGVVFVTAHLGNWELMAAYLAWRGWPISTVARSSYDDRITRFVDRWRAAQGVNAILRRSAASDAGVVRRCLRALRAGRVLGVLLDQDLTDAPCVLAPFLGREARIATGPAAMALRSGACVVAGFIARDRADPTRHRICIERVEAPPSADTAALACAMSAAIERAILRAPDEWVWMHPRWRGAGDAPPTTPLGACRALPGSG